MRTQSCISRRHVVGMAVTVGSLAVVDGMRSVAAQAAKRIEQHGAVAEQIIARSEPISEVAVGFRGTWGSVEGPVWWKEGGSLLFSDLHNNRRMTSIPGQGMSVVHKPTNRANGLAPRRAGLAARLRALRG